VSLEEEEEEEKDENVRIHTVRSNVVEKTRECEPFS
jgi:hypothetical protein